MAEQSNLLRRLTLVLLLFLLLAGAAGHLVFTASHAAHTIQESTCPIHSGMVYAEQTHSLIEQPDISIRETRDGACAWQLGADISHPPTI